MKKENEPTTSIKAADDNSSITQKDHVMDDGIFKTPYVNTQLNPGVDSYKNSQFSQNEFFKISHENEELDDNLFPSDGNEHQQNVDDLLDNHVEERTSQTIQDGMGFDSDIQNQIASKNDKGIDAGSNAGNKPSGQFNIDLPVLNIPKVPTIPVPSCELEKTYRAFDDGQLPSITAVVPNHDEENVADFYDGNQSIVSSQCVTITCSSCKDVLKELTDIKRTLFIQEQKLDDVRSLAATSKIDGINIMKALQSIKEDTRSTLANFDPNDNNENGFDIPGYKLPIDNLEKLVQFEEELKDSTFQAVVVS